MSRKSDLLTLRAGRLVATVLPDLGGALGRFATLTDAGAIDWLRPAPEGARTPLDCASFLAVPFFSRLKEDRLEFDGAIWPQRPAGWGFGHALHGFGWQGPWQVVEARGDRVVLTRHHQGADWPSAHKARQVISLAEDRLTVEVTLTNRGNRDMPAGVGFHPYFPRGHGFPRLTAQVAARHETDAAGWPIRAGADDPFVAALQAGMPILTGQNSVYSGWNGHARLEWPHGDLRLEASGPAADFLCVYTPDGQDFACVEPVSHTIDAPNLPSAGFGPTGHRRLRPGERLTTAMVLRPSLA